MARIRTLDDIWHWQEAPDEQSSTLHKRRAYRIRMVCAIGFSYGIDAALLVLFALAGSIPLWVAFAFAAAGVVHVAIFSLLFWAGIGENRANPHLTLWQMAYAIAVQAGAIVLAPQLAMYFLAIVIIIFSFGAMRITIRSALWAWLLCAAALTALLIWLADGRQIIASPLTTVQAALYGIAFALILLRCLLLGYYGTSLRVRLLSENANLARQAGTAEILATQDELTGLLNRRVIRPMIEDQIALAQRKGVLSCIAMIDIDHFKSINDRFGHLTGDEVLQTLAATIDNTLRGSDKLGRYGGEEFLVLLPATALQEAAVVLERIRLTVASRGWSDLAAGMQLTVSMGVTPLLGSDTVAAALERADSALYEAKNTGRNRIALREADPAITNASTAASKSAA